MSRAIQTRLLGRIRSNHYQTRHALRDWYRLVAAGAARMGSAAKAQFPRHLLQSMAREITVEFERAHRAKNPGMAAAWDGVVGGFAGAIAGMGVAALQAHLTKGKKRKKNPALAIVGAMMNPGKRKRRSRNEGGPAYNGGRDAGFVKEISIEEGRERAKAAGVGAQFEENLRAHKRFHGVDAQSVRVYHKADGSSKKTVEVGSISGRTQETTYISGGLVPDSNKENKFYVHEHPKGGQPAEVWLAHKNVGMKIGGTMVRTDWYRR